MSPSSATGPWRALSAAVWVGFLILVAAGACAQRTMSRVPLLVIAGPEDFTSVEMRTPAGETLWQLEAAAPSALPFLVHARVPEGFRQTLPVSGPPRALKSGEDLILESRTTSRVFVHRAFATTETTITVLSSEMRRIEPAAAPVEPSILESRGVD